MDPFNPPAWVCEPKLENCGLRVRKDGKIINTINLISKKSYVILGRNQSMADIKLEHPSISRRHAMFAHGSSGNIYLMDLNSLHGSYINGKKLEPKKREPLHDNDVCKFGASTREYLVKLDLENDIITSSSTITNNNHQNDTRSSPNTSNNKKRKLENIQDISKQNISSDNNNNNNDNNQPPNKKHKLEYVTCRHLLIKHKDSRRPKSWKEDNITRTKSEAIAIISNIRNQLLEYKNNNDNKSIENEFAQLAKKESDCNSAKRGGDLGRFKRGKIQKPFEEVAFGLEIGELSEPVETDSGIHLILRIG